MNNSIPSFADTFIPPRADPPQNKSNPAFERQSRDLPPGYAKRNERADRPSGSIDNKGHDEQVESDRDSRRRDFNEVLAKKMSKNGNRREEKAASPQDSEAKTAEPTQANIPIEEVALPDKTANNKVNPLINSTNTSQIDQTDPQKPQVIEELIKNPDQTNETIAPQAENAAAQVDKAALAAENATIQPAQVVTPAEKIVTQEDKSAISEDSTAKNTGKSASQLNAIPIKTIENKPQEQKNGLSDIKQPTQKIQAQADSTALKTEQNGDPLTSTEQNSKLQDVVKTDTASQTQKVSAESAAVKLEDIPQSTMKTKFEQSLERSKMQAATNTSTASETATNLTADKNIAASTVAPASKNPVNMGIKKTSAENPNETLTNISANSDIKADAGNTVKADIRPVSTNSIVNQVTEHIRASMTKGREQMSIALDPPELGRVMIKFQQRNGEIVGIVEANKARTHQEIADEMPQIIRSLNESGIAVKRVEVVLTDQNTQESLSDNSTDDSNNTGRQDLQNSSDNQSNQSSSSRVQTFSGQYNPAKNPDNYINTVSEDAINMYA